MAATRSPWRLLWAVPGAIAAMTGCAFEFEDIAGRDHGTVGAETFRLVCMNLAAQSFPNDLTGERFSPICDGRPRTLPAATGPEPMPDSDAEKRAFVRYQALVARRPQLVRALDEAFASDAYRADELHEFLAEMVPFYDPPELLPELTRAAAALLQQLIDPHDEVGAAALAAFERTSVRDGYRPARHSLALTRALLSYPKIDEVVRSVLGAIAPGGFARGPYEDLLRAAALDLATAENTAYEPTHPNSLALATELLLEQDDGFAGEGLPAHLTLRDVRGVAKPTTANGTLSAPFQDADGDGLADIDARGRFTVNGGAAASPYLTFDLSRDKSVTRDSFGRATDSRSQPVYQSVDADRTMLAGALRETAPLLTRTGNDEAPLLNFAYGLNALLGDYGNRSYKSGQGKLDYQGPDTKTGPLFDLVYALSTVLPFEQTDQLLQVLDKLVREHERELAGLVEAALYIDERADAHPEAKWVHPHEFWDDVIAWAQNAVKQPGLIDGLLRTFTTEEVKNLGTLIGTWARHNDRATFPLGTMKEMQALGISPVEMTRARLATPCTGAHCATCTFEEVQGIALKAGERLPKEMVCTGGQKCNLELKCPANSACVVDEAFSPEGRCGSIAQAVAAHRKNVNYPCRNPPTNGLDFLFGSLGLGDKVADPDKDCRPAAPLPAKNHKGFRGCPDEKPLDGASCADAGGVGLCSWDAGSCTCDCAGGLCRHGATPTWKCDDQPRPGYASFVDRSKPDLANGEDGHPNQSLLQRTFALVNYLHKPARFCNAADTNVILYEPTSTTRTLYEAIGDITLPAFRGPLEDLAGATGLFGPFDACKLVDRDDIIRFQFRATLGYGKITFLDEGAENLIANVFPGLGVDPVQLIDQQGQIRGFNNADPTPQGLARFNTAPPNPFLANIWQLAKSRENLNIVEVQNDTLVGWEMPDPIVGKSYYDLLVPIIKALDPNKDKDEGYINLYADLITIIHKHWSSRSADTTKRACDDSTQPPACDETKPLFSYQSNGQSYEELLAEATLDARITERIHDVMVALDSVEVGTGANKKDGITVIVEALSNLILPERSCPGGDCNAQPLAYRDGHSTTTTNTGKPIQQVSPIYLLTEALNGVDARFEDPKFAERLKAWRAARSRLVDVFFEVERAGAQQWRFKNQRGRTMLTHILPFLRERLAEHQRDQDACMATSPDPASCQQTRAWAMGLAGRLESSLGQPVTAATLRLLDNLRGDETEPASKLLDLVRYLVDDSNQGVFAASALGTADLVQTLQDTRNVAPIMKFMARALAGNANDVAAGNTAPLDVQKGLVEKALALTRELQNIAPEADDHKSTIASLLARLARPYDDASGATPLDTILDSIVAVNRAVPVASSPDPLATEDLRAILDESEQYLSSKRHGLERLYDVVRSRKLP